MILINNMLQFYYRSFIPFELDPKSKHIVTDPDIQFFYEYWRGNEYVKI
jgi:hypothetical protein